MKKKPDMLNVFLKMFTLFKTGELAKFFKLLDFSLAKFSGREKRGVWKFRPTQILRETFKQRKLSPKLSKILFKQG